MRRPPGLWILLSAGVVWLSLQDVYGLRATSLIFAKSSKTSTTTTTTEEANVVEEETVTTELSIDPNSTKPALTGNPQLDYRWDPNLPKELNGYNLSDYPFYERVPDPEEIDFKCDGLHDGFYASVAHKCQVYHHCIDAIRYDFLCANYTAFDQRTFICHFANNVDCINSKKFWHRNDNLYKATTTTTIKPIVIHTTPPQSPITGYPSGSGARRPVGARRRPFRRRRPQYDYYEDEYYDDYYEDRPRANRGRKRPRPRPRPVYEDSYDEEYEEERHERRGGNRNEERRQYDRRPTTGRRRNKDRAKPDYDDEPEERFEDEDFKLSNRRKQNNRNESEDERYPDSRKQGKRRPTTERTEDYDKVPPRKNPRRPVKDDYEDDTLQSDDARSYERPRTTGDRRNKPKEDTRAIIKPVSGTIYDRPRVAPRIKLPVPKNEADKYAYKPIEVQVAPQSQEDEEYYDDYDEPVPRRNTDYRQEESRSKNKGNDPRNPAAATRRKLRRPDNFERPRSQERPKRPLNEDYYDDYEDESEKIVVKRPGGKRATSTTSTSTTEAPLQRSEQPAVRIVKRPFLPSRGGNPYSARGLQPVGAKALPITPEKTLSEDGIEDNRDFQPSAVIMKVPPRSKPAVVDSDYRPEDFSAANPKRPSERNPLDINEEEEYDVTLNDALNPTIPNLPVRASPAAFSPSKEYTFSNFQRPRYFIEPQASAEYTYQGKPVRQAYREPLSKSSSDYTGLYSGTRENYRPRQQTEALYARY